MQWIAVILPSFISVAILEHLEQKTYKGTDFIRCVGCLTLINNMIMMVFYQYVLRTPNSFATDFTDNVFVIHYIALSVLIALVLPVIKVALNPFVSIRVERKDTVMDKADTDEKIEG